MGIKVGVTEKKHDVGGQTRMFLQFLQLLMF